MSEIKPGSINDIVNLDRNINDPVFQVLEIKPSRSKNGKDESQIRYRLAISDQEHFITGMLGTQLNEYIESEKIKKFTKIRVTNYKKNIINKKPILIILSLDVLETLNDRLGEPKAIGCEEIEAQVQNNNSTPVPHSSQQNRTPIHSNANIEVARQPQEKINYTSITALSPYVSTNWTIKARVIDKRPIKEFTTKGNPPKQGQLFSITLKDERAEIRGTFFNEEVTKNFDALTVGNVYTISGGRIKNANRQYSSVNNDYEITFDSTTVIRPAEEDTKIGNLTFDYISLSEIEKKDPKNSPPCDAAGVIVEIDGTTTINTKTGNNMAKRRISIADDSNVKIDVTLWGETAEKFDESNLNRIISIKDARLSDFRGVQLSLTQSSVYKINYDDTYVTRIRQWWDANQGNLSSIKNLSVGDGGGTSVANHAMLVDINEKYGSRQFNNEKNMYPSDYITVYASFVDVGTNKKLYYLACPNPECKGKGLTSEDNNTHYCSRCHKNTDKPMPRFAFSSKIADFTGSCYMNVIGDDSIAQKLINYKAQEWFEETGGIYDDSSAKDYRKKLSVHFFDDYVFKLRVQKESYQESKITKRVSCVSADKVDFAAGAKFFANECNLYD